MGLEEPIDSDKGSRLAERLDQTITREFIRIQGPKAFEVDVK
jgi:hypothetical protein